MMVTVTVTQHGKLQQEGKLMLHDKSPQGENLMWVKMVKTHMLALGRMEMTKLPMMEMLHSEAVDMVALLFLLRLY